MSEAIDELFGCSFFNCASHISTIWNHQNEEGCNPTTILTLADNFGVGGERTTSSCDDTVLSYHVDHLKTYPPGGGIGASKAQVSKPATNATVPAAN